MKATLLKLAATALVAAIPTASAVPAVSGRPVPELTDLDDMMTTFMDANSITAGVLGVVQDGRIIYLRGFGEDFDGNDLPENALFRIASLTKPITAACIRQLVADPVNANAFNLGQPGGGVLNCVGTRAPWPALWSPPPATPGMTSNNTTVDHLLNHEGGWDHDTDNDGSNENADMTYSEATIASQMGVPSPPGRNRTMGYILGLPLQVAPGGGSSGTTYSNYNYLALGLIAEQVSGQDLVTYIRQNVLTPQMWVPSTEILQGRTFRADQNPREPYYDDPSLWPNVYDNDPEPEQVELPYGEWDQESRIGQGGIVCSAATYLTFADRYRAGYTARSIGQPLDTTPILPAEQPGHTGSFPGGTNSGITQRPDGYRIFAVFNKNSPNNVPNYGGTMTGMVDTYLDNNVIPVINRTSDGFWTEPTGGAGTDVGGFHQPFHSFASAMAKTTSGSKIRLKPGNSDWTGKIAKRIRLDAPLGEAKIGL
jgi:CubicO group peptidase (beta-lactamase class C family)